MEKTNEVEKPLKRLVGRSAAIGVLAGLVVYGKAGVIGSLAALGGSLAAGLYITQYLKAHLSGAATRTAVLDSKMAAGAANRLALTALGGLAAYLAGNKAGVISYLLSFVLTFTILLVTEIPRARRTLAKEVTQ